MMDLVCGADWEDDINLSQADFDNPDLDVDPDCTWFYDRESESDIQKESILR